MLPGSGLKLAHMRLLAAIADRGQLKQAALALNLTQPAASRMLAEIEQLVAMPLFERHPKGMLPTDAGQAVLRRARLVAAEMENLSRDVSDLQRGFSGLVRVGAVTGPAVGYLVPAIRRLRGTARGVEVLVNVAPSTVLLPALAAGELDFIIGRLLPESDPKDFTVLPGRPEPIAFLSRRGHPLTRRKGVRLADLVRFDWVVQERGTPMRTAVETALVRSGLSLPRGTIATSSLLVTVALLAETDAVAPLSHEVTLLLSNPPVSGNFAILVPAEPIELPFYHIISLRGHGLSRAVLKLRTLVQDEMSDA